MNIMGLHVFGHDTGAALITDGRLFAIGEERLNRVKHSGFLPGLSVRYLLEASGLSDINDIDLIVGVTRYDKEGINKTVEMIRGELGYQGTIHTISHHDAHAASAFFASPFDEAVVMVMDGLGSKVIDNETGAKIPFPYRHLGIKEQKNHEEVQSFYRAKGNELVSIRKDYTQPGYMNGLGLVYMGTSVFLNLGDFGSGKVMGLAPYGGNPGKSMDREFFEITEGLALTRSEKNFVRHIDHYQKLFFPHVPVRDKQKLPDDVYTEIAYSVQKATEEGLTQIANHLYRISPCKNLCYAGGVGLNSVANKKILDNTPFEKIFIQPAACDSGIALGCALYGAYIIAKEEFGKYSFKNAYLGKAYKEEEIVVALKGIPNISFTREREIVKKCAKLLAEGKILGWFQGGSEIGPRALGHRSILCDARKPEMKDILNAKVKHREAFRPFAPSVLLELAPQYFDLNCESPYMLLVAEVRRDKRSIVPAITHVDGTARVQTVTKEDNGKFYDLIQEFYKITGVPLVLNTSFNIAGEPIVETPEDALKCFMSTEMDYLIIEDFFIDAKGPKKLVTGPVVDENRLKAVDIRGGRGLTRWFSSLKKK
ncbi:MAG TPA: carbamoyl transferase [Deltaproteobacteria bacterium]|nr:carbamoyl transferase [Deltaproteobacteria bacterium]